MSEIEQLLDIFNAEVGYLEKSKNAYEEDPTVLYDKTRGAGSDNYTKYAKEMDSLNVYNGPKQGYAWCNVFIDWCFVQALGLDRARELLIGFSAGCTQDWNWFKSKGQIVTEPQRGDLVFFGDCEHIGIVEKVDGDRIYTLEGNTSNKAELITNGGAVAKKSYLRTSRYIKGYARPKYNENSEEKTDNNEIIYLTIKRGSTGNLVRIAQEKLIQKGYRLPKYGADGYFGEETEIAVEQLQMDAFPNEPKEWDGVIGPKTWAILNSDFAKPEESYPGYCVAYGQISEDVRKVQQRLIDLGYYCGGCGADSIFGNGTLDAVKRFQRDNGLSPDGIVRNKDVVKIICIDITAKA